MLKIEKQMPTFEQLRNIIIEKNWWFVFKKFLKTCCELDNIIVNRMVYKSLTREDLFKVFVCQASNTNRTLPVSRKVKVVLNCKYLFPNPAKSWAKLGKKPPEIDFF